MRSASPTTAAVWKRFTAPAADLTQLIRKKIAESGRRSFDVGDPLAGKKYSDIWKDQVSAFTFCSTLSFFFLFLFFYSGAGESEFLHFSVPSIDRS